MQDKKNTKLFLYDFRKEKAVPKLGTVTSENREVATLEALSGLAKRKVQKNVTSVEIVHSTKNTRVAFILLPEWNPSFPPFNMARLSSVSMRAGYETKVFDANVGVYKSKEWPEEWVDEIGYNPWDGARDWHWSPEKYFDDLHPFLKKYIDEQIDKIVEYNPDVICFSMYYCNVAPTTYAATQLRDRIPGVVVAGGGPFMHIDLPRIKNSFYEPTGKHLFDYACVGEGEIIILKILAEVESGYYKQLKELQIYTQPENQRINLNDLPLPDYKDIDVNLYEFPNGALSELSRGCVAKCTFCEETHFWLYRQRLANDAITEIQHLYETKGTDVFWFLDSLVNGNLKELRQFCEEVVNRRLDIHWTGYSRCDGRMDLDFYKTLAAAGCTFLNYGCESGSNKVLKDIDKRVTKEEMEQNFIDSTEAGVGVMTNWIVGFPTEDYQDFADTLTFLWRNRDNNIIVVSTANGFGLGDKTVVGQNPERFNVANYRYCGNWVTKDHTRGKPHTLSRVKQFVIFMQQIPWIRNVAIPNRPNLPIDHYTLEFENDSIHYDIDYEEFDYRIIKTDISDWADTLVNEMFVLFRLLYRTRGAYKMNLKYGRELDLKEFGSQTAGEYDSVQSFVIDEEGNWEAEIECEYHQPEGDNFMWFDNTWQDAASALRARKLARPVHGMGETPELAKQIDMDLVRHYNNTLDLSFKFNTKVKGKWEPLPKDYSHLL